MKFKKFKDCLQVTSRINFGDDNYIFCGLPWVNLIASKDKGKFFEANTIYIEVLDHDDFDIGLLYKTDSKHFFSVLHELINWMHDHEQGISSFGDLLDTFNFFPKLGCDREYI